MYKLVIRKTNNYPFYEKREETFKTLDEAYNRLNELSKKLMKKCRIGTLQDYSLEIKVAQ